MMRRRQRGRQVPVIGGEAGSAIVEMSFVFPLLLVVTFGIVEFGRAWLIVNTMNHATREALRLAATTAGLTANDSTVISKATTILANANLTGATVTNTAPAGTPPEVTVTTALTFTYLTQIGPFFGFSFTGTIPLTSQATMRYER
jgi:Flp pilus assembly protein TadG